MALTPKGTADLVLTFRNVHNWATDFGNEQAMFGASVLNAARYRAGDTVLRRELVGPPDADWCLARALSALGEAQFDLRGARARTHPAVGSPDFQRFSLT